MKKHKIISLLLVSSILASVTVSVNADSVVTDIKKYILLDRTQNSGIDGYDTNKDGRINVFDVSRIKNRIINNADSPVTTTSTLETPPTTTPAPQTSQPVTSAPQTSQTTVSTTKAPAATTTNAASSVPGLDEKSVYNAMIAFKSQYPEGTPWTNDNSYVWNGGIYKTGYGCVAFAFMLSDAAFGKLPARKIVNANVSDIRVGDILRINNDTHSVIVLETTDEGVVLAEGNYNRSVHWGRKLTWAQVKNTLTYVMTRYPD